MRVRLEEFLVRGELRGRWRRRRNICAQGGGTAVEVKKG
jgi:hypothetical protein